MSTLRQVKKDNDPPEVDVEAPADEKGPSSPKPAAAAGAFSAASPSAGSSHNPVFLAKAVIRKVVTLLMASDEEDLTQPGGVVTLLKDVILGVILGVITISFLIFLDHRDVIHFQSAHNFRNAAFQLLNDPETIANLEESSDLKFMTVADYERKKKEIEGVTQKIKDGETVLAKRTGEWEEKKKEVDALRGDYNEMYQNPLLGIDKFCGTCHWGMKFTCDGRVKFLQDTYNTKLIEAKMSAMGHASCKKK
ncbi:hypothetical protein ACHAWF_004695 [Thalassiosira exigua]